MKNYKEVVESRFDAEKVSDNSIYSENHPIGKYGRLVLFKQLNLFLNNFIKLKGPLDSKQLLDVGCGDGGMIAYFVRQGFSATNCTGVDFSKTRIEKAKKEKSSVHFLHDDALSFKIEKTEFDLITSFDLFSHFSLADDIVKGLKNIHDHLAPNGQFLWYDIYASNHFDSPNNAESWGFSKEQMIDFSKQAGFELVSYKPLFKKFFNKYHSVYQAKRFSPGFLKLLEKFLPGSPGNQMLILKKSSFIK